MDRGPPRSIYIRSNYITGGSNVLSFCASLSRTGLSSGLGAEIPSDELGLSMLSCTHVMVFWIEVTDRGEVGGDEVGDDEVGGDEVGGDDVGDDEVEGDE